MILFSPLTLFKLSQCQSQLLRLRSIVSCPKSFRSVPFTVASRTKAIVVWNNSKNIITTLDAVAVDHIELLEITNRTHSCFFALYHKAEFNSVFNTSLLAITKQIINEPNAGGNSQISEALSVEVLLSIIPSFVLRRTELQVTYFPKRKLIDYVVAFGGGNHDRNAIAVSVTRALHPPRQKSITFLQARHLMWKKLTSLVDSTSSIYFTPMYHGEREFKITGMILHVWTDKKRTLRFLLRAWKELKKEGIGNHITVIVSLMKKKIWQQ